MVRARSTRWLMVMLVGMFLAVRAGPLCLPAQSAPIAVTTTVSTNCHEIPARKPAGPPASAKAGCSATCAPLPTESHAIAGIKTALDGRTAAHVVVLTGRDDLPPLPPPRES